MRAPFAPPRYEGARNLCLAAKILVNIIYWYDRQNFFLCSSIKMMKTMITVKEYLRFMGVHMTKESNSCMEQSVTFRTNKVRLNASGWVIVDSGLPMLSFILGLLDSIWLRCSSIIHNDAPPDAPFLSQVFPVIYINIEPRVSLKHFFWPLQVRFPDFSSPKSNFLRRHVSCILITWPVHLSHVSWYFISTVWRLIMSAWAGTWVCRILSCHLILRSFLRQFNSLDGICSVSWQTQ